MGTLITTSSTTRVKVAVIDPLEDPAWAAFVQSQPDASVFHQTGWIQALVSAYGYKPRFHVLLDEDGKVVAGWPFMLIRSPLTGTRLVCMPFCHQAAPIIATNAQAEMLLDAVLRDAENLGVRRLEVRGWPMGLPVPAILQTTHSYSRHTVDLSAGSEALFSSLSKDLRYSIRRAGREGVSVRLADGPKDLESFYRLYTDLRKRQALLPQPRSFIQLIYENVILAGDGFIVMAELDGQPIAAFLSVGHGSLVVGTHSGSVTQTRSVRANHLAMWKCMEIACERGHQVYDLGRSDANAHGLTKFKEEWGGVREELPYYHYPEVGGVNAGEVTGWRKASLDVFARYAPEPVFAAAGAALYRHFG